MPKNPALCGLIGHGASKFQKFSKGAICTFSGTLANAENGKPVRKKINPDWFT